MKKMNEGDLPLSVFVREAREIDGHLGTTIVLCDEPPKWYDDDHYAKVQETKNVFTQHQINRAMAEGWAIKTKARL